MTLPPYQTASGCVDILMHTMERYFNQCDNMELTDGISESLMRTVMKNAKILKDEPDNYDARAEVMWAGSLSHNGLTGCGTDGGDWATHKMEHEVGGLFDVAHGAGLAALWGSWARFVLDARPARFAQFATHVLGVTAGADDTETALKGIEAMEDFYHSIDMPVSSTAGFGSSPEKKYVAAKIIRRSSMPRSTPVRMTCFIFTTTIFVFALICASCGCFIYNMCGDAKI